MGLPGLETGARTPAMPAAHAIPSREEIGCTSPLQCIIGRVRPRLLMGVVLALAGLGGAVFLWLRAAPGAAPRGTLQVVSVPAGANVVVGGAVVGQTPYFADNRWGPGPVAFELTLPGYRTWRGSFPGGVEAKVEVALGKPKRKTLAAPGVIDGGVLEVDIAEDDSGPLHPYGPLRPKAPAEFVDEDLEKEAAGR